MVPAPQVRSRIPARTAPGLVAMTKALADVPVLLRVVVVDLFEKMMISRMAVTRKAMRAHHQYSLRLARPLNVAYFLKYRCAATFMDAPGYGASSGGTELAIGLFGVGYCG